MRLEKKLKTASSEDIRTNLLHGYRIIEFLTVLLLCKTF